MRSYHKNLIEKYMHIYREEEKAQIKKADKEVFIFNLYIMQFLVFWIVLSIAKLIEPHREQTIWSVRLDDIFDGAFQISYIVLQFGVSESINRALKT
jgi:hypothetical protein